MGVYNIIHQFSAVVILLGTQAMSTPNSYPDSAVDSSLQNGTIYDVILQSRSGANESVLYDGYKTTAEQLDHNKSINLINYIEKDEIVLSSTKTDSENSLAGVEITKLSDKNMTSENTTASSAQVDDIKKGITRRKDVENSTMTFHKEAMVEGPFMRNDDPRFTLETFVCIVVTLAIVVSNILAISNKKRPWQNG